MTRTIGVEPIVMEWIQKNAGRIVNCHQVALGTGFNDGQVSSCLSHLIKKATPGLERVAMGAYRYRKVEEVPSLISNQTVLFEQIAELKDGEVLIQSESGDLWIARPHRTRLVRG